MMTKAPAPFLSKTWGLLEDPNNAHLITWSPSGESFIVLAPEAFGRELLPTVFKHNNYTSFVRQLNIYGFRKLPAAHQEFSHPCFKKGQPHLMSQICRGGNQGHQNDGPAAEIAHLKSQVDKLSKAMMHAIHELQRREYVEMVFDWHHLSWVSPGAVTAINLKPGEGGVIGSVVAGNSAGVPLPQSAVRKRPIASGSMVYLQNRGDEGKSDVPGAQSLTPPAKQPKLEDSTHKAAADGSVPPGSTQLAVPVMAYPRAAGSQGLVPATNQQALSALAEAASLAQAQTVPMQAADANGQAVSMSSVIQQNPVLWASFLSKGGPAPQLTAQGTPAHAPDGTMHAMPYAAMPTAPLTPEQQQAAENATGVQQHDAQQDQQHMLQPMDEQQQQQHQHQQHDAHQQEQQEQLHYEHHSPDQQGQEHMHQHSNGLEAHGSGEHQAGQLEHHSQLPDPAQQQQPLQQHHDSHQQQQDQQQQQHHMAEQQYGHHQLDAEHHHGSHMEGMPVGPGLHVGPDGLSDSVMHDGHGYHSASLLHGDTLDAQHEAQQDHALHADHVQHDLHDQTGQHDQSGGILASEDLQDVLGAHGSPDGHAHDGQLGAHAPGVHDGMPQSYSVADDVGADYGASGLPSSQHDGGLSA